LLLAVAVDGRFDCGAERVEGASWAGLNRVCEEAPVAGEAGIASGIPKVAEETRENGNEGADAESGCFEKDPNRIVD